MCLLYHKSLLPNWKMRMSGGLWFIQFCLSFNYNITGGGGGGGGEVSHDSIDYVGWLHIFVNPFFCVHICD